MFLLQREPELLPDQFCSAIQGGHVRTLRSLFATTAVLQYVERREIHRHSWYTL